MLLYNTQTRRHNYDSDLIVISLHISEHLIGQYMTSSRSPTVKDVTNLNTLTFEEPIAAIVINLCHLLKYFRSLSVN